MCTINAWSSETTVSSRHNWSGFEYLLQIRSQFSLMGDSGDTLEENREHTIIPNFIERDGFGRVKIHIWRIIMIDSRKNLHVFQSGVSAILPTFSCLAWVSLELLWLRISSSCTYRYISFYSGCFRTLGEERYSAHRFAWKVFKPKSLIYVLDSLRRWLAGCDQGPATL